MIPSWVKPLTDAGYPPDIVVLDFETYFTSKYTLSKMSTYEYVTDSRFQELGLACLRVRPGCPDPVPDFDHDTDAVLSWLKDEYGKDLERCTVVMQNAKFDALILKLYHGFVPRFIVDTKDLHANLWPGASNKLADMAKQFNLPAKGKTATFAGYLWDYAQLRRTKSGRPTLFAPVMDEQMRTALHNYACRDVELEYAAAAKMIPMVRNLGFELRLAEQTRNLFLFPKIAFDFEKADMLKLEMSHVLSDLDTKAGSHGLTVYRSDKPFRRLLKAALGDEPLPLKKGKRGRILALAKTDPQRADMLTHSNPKVRALVAARVGAKSWPTHIRRLEGMIGQAKAAGGFLPIGMNYYGAHTGRWSGSEGINPQNLGARSEYEVINQVRGTLVAPPGCVLVVSDASQIESRVTAWVSGESSLLNAFRNKRPVYCNFASGVLGSTIRKARPTDPQAVKNYLTYWRQFGKIGVLGCGFGMGGKHLKEFAYNTYHLELSDDLAAKAVSHYRTSFSRVKKFWGDLTYAFKYVAKGGKEMRAGKVMVWRDGNTVCIRLPNGRDLYYHGAHVISDGYGEEIAWPDPRDKTGKSITRIWGGGFLTENVVQAISRDILAEALLKIDSLGDGIGLRIGHHVHDEAIGVVPVEHAKEALQLEIDLLRFSPPWAADVPLDAEGFIAERYGK